MVCPTYLGHVLPQEDLLFFVKALHFGSDSDQYGSLGSHTCIDRLIVQSARLRYLDYMR